MAKLVCTVELSKTAGISIKVVNAEAGITQTMTMDGTTLILEVAGKVAGKDAISTFTQKADSIAIKCKDFSIVADDTITCTSRKATTHHSQDTLTIQSAKDLTVSSGAKLVQSAVSDLTLAGANVRATAQSAASVQGMTAELAGDQSLTLKGTQVDLSGAQVTIGAQAKLEATSSGVATLGGSLTTVKGSLISAG